MKTKHIQKQLDFFVRDKAHHAYRKPAGDAHALAAELAAQGLDDMQRSVARLRYVLAQETPVVFPDERITLLRTVRTIPEIHTEEEDRQLHETHAFHENGRVFNMCPDYGMLMADGFTKKAEKIRTQLEKAETAEQKEFLQAMLDVLSIVTDFAARYREEALRVGNQTVADTLSKIPANAPETLLEALQFLRLLHYAMWCNGNYHNTIGRIDQFLYPYYRHDLDAGLLTKDGALELLEEFFVSCNRDSDLYIGIQQGDNGQSVVLGGRNPEGKSMYNELSEMALNASYELALIDPKINMRVDANTPLEIFEMGSRLTKIGLGFPQYSNDDVVIPSLVEKGYDPADACEYVVAACWEFIIPKCALDVPNIDAMSLADCVNECVADLETCEKFDDFYALVESEIRRRAATMGERHKNIFMKPSPIMSAFSQGALESGRDISFGLKYNNYGVHGTGIATAVDSLAAIKKYCFNEKSVGKRELVDALKSDFEGNENLLKKLRQQAPKMGTDDDFADALAVRLLDSFAGAFKDMRNDRGGRYRVGTGSAMFYIAHGIGLGATADGRRKDEVLPANYSPSLFIKQKGPISVVKSFAKPHLKNVANGGPLTLEFDSSVFRNDESVRKLAMLVRTFIALGGHQLQLNTVDRDKLLDAKAHPEKYPHLIVRVWGWSGYFVELDECYQDHVIRRIEFAL